MIDTHAHLDFPDYQDDLDQVLDLAQEAGVRRIVNIGTDLESSEKSVALAHSYRQLFAAVGVHPHDAREYSDSVEEKLRQLCNNAKVVAIGEIGLDYYRIYSPRDQQRDAFLRQIRLAKSLGLPIVVHIREAYEDALDILAAEKAYETNVVLHCFSGTQLQARKAVEYGFWLSFGGVLTFKSSRLPELVKTLPLEQILLETDAPFLAPHPYRGQRNHPALIALIYDKLAETLEMPRDELEQRIDANAEKFFEFE